MTEQKAQWIRDQYEVSAEKNIRAFTSNLNTQSLVANPVSQGTVPKPLSILEVASNLSPNDRRILQNEGAYKSLLQNGEKGDLLSVQADLQNLATTPQISQEAIAILNAALTATGETELDPNWQSQILASPAELAGFAPVLVDEVEDALNAAP